ncbi:MAG: hypothetical protein IJ220_00125 [Clostridia bacterium]|nr:hypothetical protein [Clostridia bacterium]
MKKIISLIKILFKVNINTSNEKKKKNKIVLLIGFGLYILIIFANFWNMFIDPLKEIGKAEVAINLIINMSSVLVFMTSITYIVNLLYFTNDMENIIPFPFKPREIFVAKLVIAYIYELMIATMLSLPGFLVYGFELGKGVIYYIYAIIVYMLIPIVPIIVLTIFYTIFMQFFKMNRYKNFFKVFSTVIILVAIVGFQIRLNANMMENGSYDGFFILNICNQLKMYAPYYLKVAYSVFENQGNFSSLISIIWFVIINIVIITTTVFGFEKLYMRAIYNSSDSALKVKRQGKIFYKKRSVFFSIVNIEIKKLFRNITFFIQTVLPTSLMPAIILVTMLSSKSVSNEIDINSNQIIKMMFAYLILQFFMMMNQISSTAISRDGGEEASYVKSLPISKMKMIDAKAMPSIYVGMFNLCLAMIFNYLIFDLSWIEVIQVIIAGVLLNFIQSYLFLIIDFRKPKLNWESEVAVVKHNMNVLKSIMIWFGVIIFTAVIGNIFLIVNGIYFSYAYILLLILAYVLIRRYLKQNSEKLYEKIY